MRSYWPKQKSGSMYQEDLLLAWTPTLKQAKPSGQSQAAASGQPTSSSQAPAASVGQPATSSSEQVAMAIEMVVNAADEQWRTKKDAFSRGNVASLMKGAQRSSRELAGGVCTALARTLQVRGWTQDAANKFLMAGTVAQSTTEAVRSSSGASSSYLAHWKSRSTRTKYQRPPGPWTP